MKYKFLEHTADVKFQAYGKTIEEAFENAAMALKETILKGKKIKIKNKIKKAFVVEGGDDEKFLYNFLEEFLYLLDAEDFLFNKVRLKFLKIRRLEAEVWGDKASNYKFSNDVKAVTYNEMYVKKDKNKYIVQVVLDV